MTKKLNLDTICLKRTLAEEKYLKCKGALIKIPRTCSGEFKQRWFGSTVIIIIRELRVKLDLSVSRIRFTSGVHGKKCNSDYNNHHHYHYKADDDIHIIAIKLMTFYWNCGDRNNNYINVNDLNFSGLSFATA